MYVYCYYCYYYFTRAVYRPKEGTAVLLGGGLALRPSRAPEFVVALSPLFHTGRTL